MDHALHTPEVLALILSHLLDRGFLLRAALTCRTWKDPALDQLWRDLESPLPLMKLLGSVRVDDNAGIDVNLVRK